MPVLLVLPIVIYTYFYVWWKCLLTSLDDNTPIVKTHSMYLLKIRLLLTIAAIACGQNIFISSLLSKCADIQEDHNLLQLYKDNQVWYRAVADEAGLSGSYGGSFTLKISLLLVGK